MKVLDKSVQILTGNGNTYATNCTVFNTTTRAVSTNVKIDWALDLKPSENSDTVLTSIKITQNSSSSKVAFSSDLTDFVTGPGMVLIAIVTKI